MVGEGITDTDLFAGITGAAGGDHVLPFIPLAYGLGASLNAVYSVGKAVDSYRYWNDYYRNTGVRPRYPFRAGEFDSLGYGGRISNSLGRAYYYWR